MLEVKIIKNNKFYTISETASICGITPRTLRHYQELGLLTPTSTNPNTGYRGYNYANLERIILILTLKDTNMPLKDIKNYLERKKDVKHFLDNLYKQKAALETSINIIKLYDAKNDVLNPKIIELPESLCLTKHIIATDIIEAAKSCHEFIYESLKSYKCDIRKQHSFVEYPTEAFINNEVTLTNFPMIICIPIDKNNPPKEAVVYNKCEAVSVCYKGEYSKIGIAYKALFKYIKDHGLTRIGNPREIYIEGEDNINISENQYVTQVIIPIKNL